jgi:hypothetical protein
MHSRRAFVIGTAALTRFGHVASAQDVSRDRGHLLDSTLGFVVATSGTRHEQGRIPPVATWRRVPTHISKHAHLKG